jgi:branched-chain amino acid transport system substrate-binding protein
MGHHRLSVLWIAGVLFTIIIFAVAASAAEPYVVGVLPSLTGPLSVPGEEQAETAGLAAKWINERWGGINGRPLKLVIEDTKTDPATCLTKFKKLDLEDKASAILFMASSAEASGLADQSNRIGLPTLFQVGTLEVVSRLNAANSYCFRTWYTTNNHVDSLFDAVLRRPVKTIALMYDDTAYGETGRIRAKQLIAANPKTEMVLEIKFSYKGLEFTPEALRVRTRKPDAVLMISGGVPSGAALCKNIKEVGYEGFIFATAGLYSKIAEVGPIVNGVLTDLIGPGPGETQKDIPNPSPELIKLMQWGEQNVRKTKLTWVSIFGWDNVFIIANAIKNVGSDRKKIRDFLDNFEYEGSIGTTKYSPGHHEGLMSLKGAYRVMEAKDGKWVPVK